MADTLPTLTKEISQRKIDVYSGVKPHSIHTDEAWARERAEAGLTRARAFTWDAAARALARAYDEAVARRARRAAA